jgi:hypothetical protein
LRAISVQPRGKNSLGQVRIDNDRYLTWELKSIKRAQTKIATRLNELFE